MAKALAARVLAPYLGYSLFGLLLLANQTGESASRIVDLSWISWTWRVNAAIEAWSLSAFLIVIGVLVVLHVVSWNASFSSVARRAFVEGMATGFLGLPAITLCIALAGLVLYLFYRLFGWASWLLALMGNTLSSLLSPVGSMFAWVRDHFLAPVGRFLSPPFVWLWDHLLQPIVGAVGAALGWINSQILTPLFELFMRFVVKPILVVIAGALGINLLLLPFAAIGKVTLDSARLATRDKIDSTSAFVYGVSVGFVLFDIAVSYSLHAAGLTSFYPAVSHYLLLLPPAAFLARLAIGARDGTHREPQLPYSDRLRSYWATSRLEVFTMALVVPAMIALTLLSTESDPNSGA